MIYTVGGIKGGGGKTTTATNLVIWLSRQGKDVLLVDADEQETSTDFTAWREETLHGNVGYTAIQLTGENVRREVGKLQHKFDAIVIDTGGRDTTSQRAAIFVSDVLLLPFNPQSFDIWTVTKLQKLLEEIRSIKPDALQALVFLNRAESSGIENLEAAEALMATEGFLYLDAPLIKRKAVARASGKGLSVWEYTPADEKAIIEFTNLFNKIPK
jgi:chromosome partitioning protein